MEFEPVGIMPGGEMRIVRESPTSAYVRFKAGSVEPAHHHTFGHDLVVIKGKKKVWNLTRRRATTWWTDGSVGAELRAEGLGIGCGGAQLLRARCGAGRGCPRAGTLEAAAGLDLE